MALATTPMVNGVIRPACKRSIAQRPVVIMEEAHLPTYVYHKQCLSMLMDIYEKGATSGEAYENKIDKIASMVTSENDSIFQTFCGVSFLDRYHEISMISCIMRDLDSKMSTPLWQMNEKLRTKCFQLLTRMSMIENLSALDADLMCLLCRQCKTADQSSEFFDLLLEIGRSVWPYLKRPLWHNEPFVDFVADIFETIGDRLENMYPRNFSVAWKIICEILVSSKGDMSCYSRLRLLAVVEHRHRKWSLLGDAVEFYRKQYVEFTDTRKKEILSFIGFLSSRRKTSLTVKPGRSAADFLKRRQSCEKQDIDERCSTSSGGSSETLSEVFEDVFEANGSNRVFSPTSSTSSFKNRSPSLNKGVDECNHEDASSKYCIDKNKSIRDNETVIPTKNGHFESTKQSVNVKENTKEHSCKIGERIHVGQQNDRVIEKQKENSHKGEEQSKELRNEEIKSGITLEAGSANTWSNEVKNGENVWQESGNKSWRENDDKKEIKAEENIWQETRNDGMDETDHIKTDIVSNHNVPEHRSFLLGRKKDVIKVPKKYVGRVLGTQHSVITSIQDETGARIHFVRPQKEKVVQQRPVFSMTTVKNIVHNTLGLPMENGSTSKTSTTDDDPIDESKGGINNDETTVVKDDQEEEFEFHINGTDESIQEARWKIETIISHAKYSENHPNLKRSFSDGDEAHFNNFRRRVIVKVAGKYVGRVIGSGGGMIMTIEQESGAKVNFLKDQRAAKYRTTYTEGKDGTKAQNDTATEVEANRLEKKRIDPEVETLQETIWEEKIEEIKENEQVKMGEKGKFFDEHKSLKSGDESEEQQNDKRDNTVLPEEGVSAHSEEGTFKSDNLKVEDKGADLREYDFEIVGTNEAIEKAKRKIEYIMKLVDSPEKKPFTRSYSCSFQRKNFKPFQRSLSCPISDWGESCTGECASCRKGCYCRSFLLEKSESPCCWVRPEVLALTQDADWAEWIVRTKVDDPTLWRPRKSSNASNNSGSSEDISNDCTSPRDFTPDGKATIDIPDNTFSSAGSAENKCTGVNSSDVGDETKNENIG